MPMQVSGLSSEEMCWSWAASNCACTTTSSPFPLLYPGGSFQVWLHCSHGADGGGEKWRQHGDSLQLPGSGLPFHWHKTVSMLQQGSKKLREMVVVWVQLSAAWLWHRHGVNFPSCYAPIKPLLDTPYCSATPDHQQPSSWRGAKLPNGW